jgi:multiple sugar transport system ATP-binding protein
VARDGSVAQCGSPLELYHRPCNQFVAGFIGSPKMNFLPGTLASATPEVASVELGTQETLHVRVNATGLPAGSPVTIGVRPEDAEASTAAQHLVCTVQWQERLGESTYLYLDSGVAGAPWVVKAPGNAWARTGERLAICMPPQHLHLFDAQGLAMPRTVANDERVLATV